MNFYIKQKYIEQKLTDLNSYLIPPNIFQT